MCMGARIESADLALAGIWSATKRFSCFGLQKVLLVEQEKLELGGQENFCMEGLV